jgi:hypothetical protein
MERKFVRGRLEGPPLMRRSLGGLTECQYVGGDTDVHGQRALHHR